MYVIVCTFVFSISLAVYKRVALSFFVVLVLESVPKVSFTKALSHFILVFFLLHHSITNV